VLISPSAYKGSISPKDVALAIASGVKLALPDADLILAPVADGGDGTMDVLKESLSCEYQYLFANDALGVEHECPYLLGADFVMLELSAICGLGQLGERRAALTASTYGLGQAIAQVLKFGLEVNNIFVTVGGSASTDGGAGALAALGFRFLDEDEEEISLGGGELVKLRSIAVGATRTLLDRMPSIKIITDVDNPLLGKYGAARIYAPQKGANAADVEILENGLSNFAAILEDLTGRQAKDLLGAGAAGGTAFGLNCALGAEIVAGAPALGKLIDLEAEVQKADLVFTGEGALDAQSLMGKATGHLRDLCAKHKKPLFIVPAFVDPNFDWRLHGVAGVRQALVGGRVATEQDICVAAEGLLCESKSD
jgi:glycerate kinase